MPSEKKTCELCGKKITPGEEVILYQGKVQSDQNKMYRHEYGECKKAN